MSGTVASHWHSVPYASITCLARYHLVSPYAGAFTGAVTTTVYRDPGDLTLAFQYHFTNTTVGAVQDIIRATIGDPTFPWLGYVISDAGSDTTAPFGNSTAGGGTIFWTDGDPNFLLRDPTISGEGLTIQWRSASDGTVLRNSLDDSALIWFDTNALAYQTTNVGILDSGLVSTAEGYAPLTTGAIPEPATIALVGFGLAALARRRRKS